MNLEAIMTVFYLIRHGQTTANVQGLKQGTINTAITQLTATGISQAERLHDQFDWSFANRIVVSPLDRTQQTAAIVNQTALLPVELDDRLLEISYGSWDGQSNAALQAQHPDVFDPVLNDVLPTYVNAAPDGESFGHVMGRVDHFMRDFATQAPDEAILAVTHGFTIKAAVLTALSLPETVPLPEPMNTSVTKISFEPQSQQYYLWYYNRFDASSY